MNTKSGPNLAQVQATYDAIALNYAAANHERAFLEDTLRQLEARLPDRARVLDLGCGPGFDSARLARRGWHVIGVDVSWEMLRIARRESNAELVQADVRCLPFASGFDGALAVASFVHIPRSAWPALLAQTARLLKPGGWLYLSVKAGQGEAWVDQSYGQTAPRFFVYWQPAALDALLVEAGFDLSGSFLVGSQSGGWINRLAFKCCEAETSL